MVTTPVLVATDGGRTAANALAFTATYAEQHGVPVEVVSVVEPVSELPMPLPHRAELEEAHLRGVAERVRQHVRDIVGPVDWPIRVRLGRRAPAICAAARETAARMIVLGVDAGASGGNDTAVELLHLADVPVLVAHGLSLPRSAVVGMDFRPASVRAAAAAAHMLGPGGVLHLVHVKPLLDFPAAAVWEWGRSYEFAVKTAFDDVVAGLAPSELAEVHRHTRGGDPAEELVRTADRLGAELLAIGGDGYICHHRVVVGRVARRVLAGAEIPVLATPVTTRLDAAYPRGPTGQATVSNETGGSHVLDM